MGPHLTQPTNVPSGILIHAAVWSQHRWAENWGLLCPFGGVGSPSNTMWPGPGIPPCQVAFYSIQPFGHNRHGPKVGAAVPLSGELGLHLTQCRLGRGSPPYTKWHLDPSGRLAKTDMGRKLGAVPLIGGGSPSNTIWPGPRPTIVPSGILIYPTV